jgi:SM-20-related protein
LRVYDATSHTDVSPVGGTLACFLSRESEHEVLESHGERFSVAGWFKVRPFAP